MDHRESQTVRPGIIREGWAVLCLDGKPICFFGRGDYLPPPLFEQPMAVKPIGLLRLQVSDGRVPTDAQGLLLQALARHVARLTQTAIVKTADLLLELEGKLRADGEAPVEIRLPLNQTELAMLLGMSGVHMNRTLMALKAMNAVSHDHGVYKILDRERLAAVAADIS